jgi:hypothetical protein
MMGTGHLHLFCSLIDLTDSVERQLRGRDEAPKFKRVGKTS